MTRTRLVLAAALLAALASTAVFLRAQTPAAYTVVTKDARRTVSARASGSVDFLPLDQLAAIFGFTVKEDRLAGGVTIAANGQLITLSVGQSLASAGGRFVSMAGPVTRQGATWSVPTDFLSRALGPVLGQRIEVRHGSRLILVDVRMPQVASRIDRQGPNARLVVEFQPPTPHSWNRDGTHLVVHFEADQLDSSPLVGVLTNFVTEFRIDGASLIFELGPLAGNIRATEESDRLVLDLIAPAGSGSTAGRASQPQEPPPVDLGAPSGLRVVVIDAGHGGDDEGVHGADGVVEKDLTLQVARRLKGVLESRGGLRVLLTRDADENVPVDRRAALANNNKADVFISLHANASWKPEIRGAQVLSLNLDDYKRRGQAAGAGGPRVPVAGGGTRAIDAVPWELAQIPYAARSAVLASLLARHLTDRNVRMFGRPSDTAPLGVLVGANMPAVLVEMGFLTNADDERALSSGGDGLGTVVDAIAAAIGEVRNGIPEPPVTRPIR